MVVLGVRVAATAILNRGLLFSQRRHTEEIMKPMLRRRMSVVTGLVLAGGLVASSQGRPVEKQVPARALGPVTDIMLANPDPSEWLHWRRTLDGWGYSPLEGINRENVSRLQLMWSRMTLESERLGAPIVHDGMIFLAEPRG